MRVPWANGALLILVGLQIGTGFAGLLGATDGFRFAFWLHVVGAYGIFVLLFAKALIVNDAIRRRPRATQTPAGAVGLVVLLAVVMVSGFVWSIGGRRVVAGVSLINWHAYVAIALAVLLVWHVADRRWIVKVPGAADRGAFLRLAGVFAAGIALWGVERVLQPALGVPGAKRRWTGSYEVGSGGGAFPETSWLNDDPAPIDQATWILTVDGAVARPLHYDLTRVRDVISRGRVEALLDCTGGWFTRQTWTGVTLFDLLDLAQVQAGGDTVRVTSVTGYARLFSLDHARRLILATHVAGAPLSHGHGAPLRLVVPERRGFDWVKWVTHVEVLRSSHLLQSPLPLS